MATHADSFQVLAKSIGEAVKPWASASLIGAKQLEIVKDIEEKTKKVKIY